MGVYIKGIDLPKEAGNVISINIYDKKDNWLDNIEIYRKDIIEIDIVRCVECKKVDTKKCPMYSAGWGYTDDDWCSEGERRADE